VREASPESVTGHAREKVWDIPNSLTPRGVYLGEETMVDQERWKRVRRAAKVRRDTLLRELFEAEERGNSTRVEILRIGISTADREARGEA